MIEGWRICRAPFADLLGEGARLYGGRWNSPGRPLVYLAEHPALAALEVRVHLDLPHGLLPDDYVLVRVDLPDEPPEEVATLPADTVAAGDAWITAATSAVLRVPSVLVPSAYNLLLNPRHPRAAEAQIASTEPFQFDARLWAGVSMGSPKPVHGFSIAAISTGTRRLRPRHLQRRRGPARLDPVVSARDAAGGVVPERHAGE